MSLLAVLETIGKITGTVAAPVAHGTIETCKAFKSGLDEGITEKDKQEIKEGINEIKKQVREIKEIANKNKSK